MAEGDVVIYYKLVPTEDSIRATAERVTSSINKTFGGGKGKTSDGLPAEQKKLIKSNNILNDTIINLYRLLSKRQEFSTKVKAFDKMFGSGKSEADMFKTPRIQQILNSINPGRIGIGEAGGAAGKGGMLTGAQTPGTTAGGAEGTGAAGGLAGIAGGIASAVGLLGVIAIAMMLIGAFFEAVGPFIKVVMKLFAAFFLIALLPALKLLMTNLPLIWTVLKVIAKGIAFVLQAIIDAFGAIIGNVDEQTGISAGKIDWGKLLLWIFAPVPMLLATFLGPLIISLGQQLFTWLATALPAFIESAVAVIKGVIDWIGEAIFGKSVWNSIKDAIAWLSDYLFNTTSGAWNTIQTGIEWLGSFLFATGTGAWNTIQTGIETIAKILDPTTSIATIKSAINTIATDVFGKETWDTIKGVIAWLYDNIFVQSVWDPLSNAISTLVTALTAAADKINSISWLWGGSVNTNSLVKSVNTNSLVKSDGTSTTSKFLNKLNVTSPTVPKSGVSAEQVAADKAKYADFISRPGAGVANFSPNDTIIGMKDPSKLGGGTTINNTYYIDGKVDKNALKEIMNQMAREQGKQLRGKVSYTAGFYA